MQRNTITLLLTFFIIPTFCDAHSYVNHLRKQLDKAMHEKYEDVTARKEQEINNLFNMYNPTAVSSENEQFIRDVLDEVGLDGNSINLWHKQGVYACAIGPNICIDQDWFNTLNKEQKRFVIGHEAMHIKGNHIDYKTYLLMNQNDYEPVQALGLSFDFETEADLKAAKKLNCCDGGISVLKSFRETKLKSAFRMIDDHPSCAERIFNLEQLKQQMKDEADKAAAAKAKAAKKAVRVKAAQDALQKSWGYKLGQWFLWKNQKAKSAFVA